ncbi:MAG: hypothetical protein AB1646_19730 [Thermodesulfobacteriota bacterium]
MGVLQRIRNAVRRRNPWTRATARISVDESSALSAAVQRAFSDLNWISALFPQQIYEIMDGLVMTMPYASRYLHQTITLGNQGHSLEIDAPTEKQAQRALQVINDLAARCFPFGGGADGLINGLLSQVGRTGGCCCEWVPDERMARLERAYLVPVRTLRFRYDPVGELELGQVQDGRFVPLNPLQTAFTAVLRQDGNPYPVPPIISSLKSAAATNKIMDSIQAWIGKLSSLGVLLAEIERPPMNPGESQDQYDQRAGQYLDAISKSISENFAQGFGAAYDNIKMSFQNTTAGAQGARDVLQMVLQGLFAGLGRDPVFFGWNFNSTETFATVVFREMCSSIANFQRGVKRCYEQGLRLALTVEGLGDVGVSVNFNLNDTLDEFQSAEADMMRANGVVSQFQAGIISVEEARRELGHDQGKARSGAVSARFSAVANRYVMEPRGRKSLPGETLLQKGCPPGPLPKTLTTLVGADHPADHGLREAMDAARRYLLDITRKLTDAGRAGVQAVWEWARVHEVPESEVFVAEALRRFTEGAEGTLDAATLEGIAQKHVGKIWRWARYEDDTVFGPDWEKRPRGVGVVLGEQDHTAINYLSRVDRLCVSKYVSRDEQTRGQIQTFLQEQYLERGLGRGKSKKEMQAFKERFGELVDRIGEHRARVIIDTGVSRAQNWGQVLALHDEEITQFRIAGPWDRLTCDWCRGMQGRVFEVRREVVRIESIIASGEEDISKFDKFITSRFPGKQGLEVMKSMSDADVQSTGMVTAPIHPQCRHRVVALVRKG